MRLPLTSSYFGWHGLTLRPLFTIRVDHVFGSHGESFAHSDSFDFRPNYINLPGCWHISFRMTFRSATLGSPFFIVPVTSFVSNDQENILLAKNARSTASGNPLRVATFVQVSGWPFILALTPTPANSYAPVQEESSHPSGDGTGTTTTSSQAQ
jgi:hypothetical protein